MTNISCGCCRGFAFSINASCGFANVVNANGRMAVSMIAAILRRLRSCLQVNRCFGKRLREKNQEEN